MNRRAFFATTFSTLAALRVFKAKAPLATGPSIVFQNAPKLLKTSDELTVFRLLDKNGRNTGQLVSYITRNLGDHQHYMQFVRVVDGQYPNTLQMRHHKGHLVPMPLTNIERVAIADAMGTATDMKDMLHKFEVEELSSIIPSCKWCQHES